MATGTSTNLTIVMNESTNSQPTTEWNYIIHSVQTNFYYLTLTQDTNPDDDTDKICTATVHTLGHCAGSCHAGWV